MLYVRALLLALALAVLVGGATYLVTGIEVSPFNVPREAWAALMGAFAFCFTLQDQIRHG